MSTIELGKKYNCSSNTISNRLKENTINVTKLIKLPIEQIIEDYKSGISTYELGKKYNCSYSTIRNNLKKYNLQLRTTNEHQILKLPMEQIIEEYESGINTYELGEKYKCSYNTILYKLREYNVDIRTCKESNNIISICVCDKCGHEYEGKPRSQYCPDCLPNEYCDKWNDECREHNRNKYDRECFFCGKSEEENGKRLDSHHVDNNKNQGCDEIPWKLVPLCMSCHRTVGGGEKNRKMWEARILWLLDNIR